MKPQAKALLAMLGLLSSRALSAQAPAFGAEFTANSNTTSSQAYPSVAGGTDGSFVVVWQSSLQDGAAGGIFGQRYDTLGSAAGPEFQVNTYTTNEQRDAAVARLPGGGFVVVWRSADQDLSGDGIIGQRFDASGAKVGSEFPVNTVFAGDQQSPQVAADAQGGFVVVWETYYAPGITGKAVSGQKFDASGNKVGAEFDIPTGTTAFQALPKVAIRPGGDFMVVWTNPNGNGAGLSGVLGRAFAANGQPLGTNFRVPTYTAGRQFRPTITAGPAGTFVVVWESDRNHQGYGASPIYGQRFNLAGERAGPEFEVSANSGTSFLQPSIAVDAAGAMLAAWPCPQTFNIDICGQRLDRTGSARGGQFLINTYTTNYQVDANAAHDGLGFVVAWRSSADGDPYGVSARRQRFRAEPFRVDAHSVAGVASDLNGVLEPGEAVQVEPAWKSMAALTHPLDVTGSAASLTGPAGGIYLVNDSSADYGSVSTGSGFNCYNATAGHDCYVISVAGARPSTHWDATYAETLSTGGGQAWLLHIGDSFSDVPRSQPFYQKIETVLHHGITAGCSTTAYCPADPVSRSQMAIFISKGIVGLGENVPSTGTLLGSNYECAPNGQSLFADVAPTDSFCKHVHFLATENVTLGCGVAAYCPGQTITRDAMASFIAKALVAPGGGNAVPISYGPDPQTGLSYSCDAGSPNTHFSDVPVSQAFCKHIHFLWAKGIVAGCSTTQYCPGDPVKRDAMAKFIANGFHLELYGP